MVGIGRKVKFWKDLWCEDQTLKEAFPNLFVLAINKDEWVLDAWEEGRELGSWNPLFSRHFNDWEMGKVDKVLEIATFGREKRCGGCFELERK